MLVEGMDAAKGWDEALQLGGVWLGKVGMRGRIRTCMQIEAEICNRTTDVMYCYVKEMLRDLMSCGRVACSRKFYHAVGKCINWAWT